MIELNKIYNEDCLEGMKRIPDKSIDCIICDLPYGTTSCKWDKIIPFERLWEQYNRIIKKIGQLFYFPAARSLIKLYQVCLNYIGINGYGLKTIKGTLLMQKIDQ